RLSRDPMVRALLIALLLGCQGDPPGGLRVVGEDRVGDPLPGLDAAARARFDAGDALFDEVFVDALGLGPVYIRASCGPCHADDLKGPGAVPKMAIVEADGVTPAADQSALPYGHTVRPQVSDAGRLPLLAPTNVPGLKITLRVGPAVIGRGYIDAVD